MIEPTVLAWVVLFSPLAAAFVITLFAVPHRKLASALSIGSLLVSFTAAVAIFCDAASRPAAYPIESYISWLDVPGFSVVFGILLDPLSILMTLVVTGVGSAIFIYSLGYMHDDPGYSRYFACLSLFAFSMLGIVLSNNFVQIFIFWELVGVSSYLLIGHWFEKHSASYAGIKAFMVNRVGDFGFLVGILYIWSVSGLGGFERTFNFVTLEERLPELIQQGLLSPTTLALLGALIFCGVAGKSAQFPLHVWLPDAMEGPTPVSALIHAATMVAAGVYLLCRVFFLFTLSATAMQLVAGIGAFTAIFAASLALVQGDIKRILAYSTLSQLGYMVMAVGLGGTIPGMYHLTTHAFFKALLFLGAGSVIHALHTNEIWEMGNLARRMPITTVTFLLATLALCGVFPLSGFWSKDEILALAYHENRLLFWVGTATAFLTACYMGRAIFVAFLGKKRWKHEPHESPAVMTVPLMILAFFSVAAGFFGIPAFIHSLHGTHVEFTPFVAFTSSAAAFGGLAVAYLAYYKEIPFGMALRSAAQPAKEILIHKYYIDDLYDWFVRRVQGGVAWLCSLFERYIIIGFAVNGTAWVTRKSGAVIRYAQTGKVQTYALVFFLGILALIFYGFAR